MSHRQGLSPPVPVRRVFLAPQRCWELPPSPGRWVQPEFRGMQGMRWDFRWLGCGRGAAVPHRGQLQFGGVPTLSHPPHPITPQRHRALRIPQPRGALGAMGAPSSARPQLQLGTGTWAAAALPRGPGHGAGAHRPPPAGARGALAPRPQPQERRGRARAAFSLPSPPHSQAHPILAALQKQTLRFPGLERCAAAGGRLVGEGSFPLPA